jgi:hypothetical protein
MRMHVLYSTVSFAILLACATPAFAADDEIIITAPSTVALIDAAPADQAKPVGTGEVTPTPPQANNQSDVILTNIGTQIGTERNFVDQRFTLYPGVVNETSLDFAWRKLSFGTWIAETAQPAFDEKDFYVKAPVGPIDVKYNFIVLKDTNVSDWTFSHGWQLNKVFRATFSYERMRAGFVDDIYKMSFSANGRLADRLGWDAALGIAHDRFNPGWGASHDLGLSYRLTDHVTLRGSNKGFAGGGESASTWYIGVSWHRS